MSREIFFGRYEIRNELGSGGMASVYRAYDPRFEREVALKILQLGLFGQNQLLERFEHQLSKIAKLESSAIVPVYDIGLVKDELFFVMRYMSGGSLAQRIGSSTLSLDEIARIVQSVGAALDEAHAHGLLHGDLKPGNILFDQRNNAYVSDFGVARIAHTPAGSPGSGIIGTPAYMSPEQARGQEVDRRSDLYSLGVILFEMLTGRKPFEAETPMSVALKHINEPAPNILEINPRLPARIQFVVEKALAKDRDERFQSGMELAEAFRSAIRTDTIDKSVSEGMTQKPIDVGHVGSAVPERPRDSLWSRIRKRLAGDSTIDAPPPDEKKKPKGK
jgi:serine/threonine protein kinase